MGNIQYSDDYTIDYMHIQGYILLTIYIVKIINNWLYTQSNAYIIDYIHSKMTIKLTIDYIHSQMTIQLQYYIQMTIYNCIYT